MPIKSITQIVQDYGPQEAILQLRSAIEAVADVIDDPAIRDEYEMVADALDEVLEGLADMDVNPPALRNL